MENEFIDILGYEGKYKINRLGEIYSIKGKKILRHRIDTKGYRQICLCVDYEKKYYLIHRLLATQFIPNIDNLPEVDHIDRNILNNDLLNLRWVNRTTNSRNKDVVINCKGSVHIKRQTNKGTYYQAQYYIDYGKKLYIYSYDLKECEDFLEECKIKYPRDLP